MEKKSKQNSEMSMDFPPRATGVETREGIAGVGVEQMRTNPSTLGPLIPETLIRVRPLPVRPP